MTGNTENVLAELSNTLSADSKILQDKSAPEFSSSLKRWSDHQLQTPLAIIQPASEEDIVKAIQALLKASIPFVPASGGNTPYSTIENGVIVDLSLYRGVEVHAAENRATVRGGTLMKELQLALHPHKQFAAVANANTVGVVPYYIGGGTTHYKPFVGFAAENIVAAKIITAQGELLEVSESQNPELLWGIRGAGQFLGLVTELVITTYPYAALGTDETSQRICGTFIFPPQQAGAVLAALRPIVESNECLSAGHLVVAMAPPDMQHQVLLVAPELFAVSPDEAARLLQPLADLQPLMQMQTPSTFATHSDHLDYLCAKGDLKRASQIGLTADWLRSEEKLNALITLHAELVSSCPDAVMSAFSFQWNSPRIQNRDPGTTAFGLEDIDHWLNCTTWYKNPANHGTAEAIVNKAKSSLRKGSEEHDYVSYTNLGRDDPIDQRYKGTDRLERLKGLKKTWDPTGVFTTELL